MPHSEAKNRYGSQEELTSFDGKLTGRKLYHAPQESYHRKPRYPSGGDHYTVSEASSERPQTAFHHNSVFVSELFSQHPKPSHHGIDLRLVVRIRREECQNHVSVFVKLALYVD